MKISPFDRLRSKQDRAFQARVLATLEKPKPSKLVAAINSRFFIWFLSAILVSVGGVYFSNYQQCVRDAETLSDKHARLSNEIFARREAIMLGAARAKTADEILRLYTNPVSIYSDLKPRSLADLEHELVQIEKRFEFSSREQWAAAFDAIYGEEGPSLVIDRNFRIRLGDINPYLTDDDLPELKKTLAYNFETYKKMRRFDYATSLSPNCSVSNIFRMVFGYQTKILSADTQLERLKVRTIVPPQGPQPPSAK